MQCMLVAAIALLQRSVARHAARAANGGKTCNFAKFWFLDPQYK